MSTALLVVAVAGVLACPLHMLWANRRGKRPLCCPPRNAHPDALRERQQELAKRIRSARVKPPSGGRREANL